MPLFNIEDKVKIMINEDIIDCQIKARYKREDGYYYRVVYMANKIAFSNKGSIVNVPYPNIKIIKESELFVECVKNK
jgi:hypothetical protein